MIVLILSVFLPNNLVLAGSKDPPHGSDDGSGSVSVTTTYPLPALAGTQPGGLITPDGATLPLPGAGYAWAQASLGWNIIKFQAQASTGVSADALGLFTLGAQVFELYRNGTFVGSTSMVYKYFATGGSSKTATFTKYGIPYGYSWTAYTKHQVICQGVNWGPSLSISANP